jgi:hypothetical protein
MDEDNLKELWAGSNKEQKVEIDHDKLIESLSQKVLFMEEQIKRRDNTEIFIGLLMIALFGWWFFAVPSLLAKIGAAIIVVNCILVIVRLRRAKKVTVKEEPSSKINQNLRASLQLLRQQIKLSSTVLWWYLLPFFIGVICFVYAFVSSITANVIYTLIVALVYAYIWYCNKKVVINKLKPLEKNIVEALKDLSNGD